MNYLMSVLCTFFCATSALASDSEYCPDVADITLRGVFIQHRPIRREASGLQWPVRYLQWRLKRLRGVFFILKIIRTVQQGILVIVNTKQKIAPV